MPNPNLSNTNASDLVTLDGGQQFIRHCTLLVATAGGKALDLSQFRIKFQVKRSSTMTPNVADIRVYNLEEDTAVLIRKEFTRVILQAGYDSNYGVIFSGNIKQVILGRESATDTFIDIIAGDGDRAYNFAVVTKTLAAGSSQQDQVNAALNSFSAMGVTSGAIPSFPTTALPRGKAMYGNARKYLRNAVQTVGGNWSIQDEAVTFVTKKGFTPGTRVVLTSKTGMIGTPQQTNVGVNVKCLLDPNIRVNGRIVIDNKSLEQFKINLSVPLSPANIPAPVTFDGTYFVLVVQYDGDTRGIEWYTSLVCLNMDVTTNPINAVELSSNGLPQ